MSDKMFLKLPLMIFFKKQPQNLTLALYAADLALRTTDTHHAHYLLKKAYGLTTDPLLQTKILFQRGLLEYELGHFKQAYTLLENGYALKQEYPPLLNLLAYYHATQDKNMDRAITLIKSALTKDASNPHFLDTHALIVYKQKDYKAAHALWECSLGFCEDDPTIFIHMSKNYYKQGDRKQALKSLQQAQKHAQTDEHSKAITALLNRWNFNHE